MKDSLAYGTVQGAAKNANQKAMDEHVSQCEKAIQTGKKADLPKAPQSKLEELRLHQNAAFAKASSPPKPADA